MISLIHPTGNSNVRAATVGLRKADLLLEFNTSIASFQGSLLDAIGKIGPFSEIRRRRFDPDLRKITRTWPWLEAGRLIALKTGLTKLTKQETGFFCIESVYKNLDKHVASNLHNAKKRGIKGIYAYEDGAYFSFQKAKSLQLKCFYDLPIGYWRTAKRLLENERQLKPEWASTLTGFQDSDEKLFRKDEELKMADQILVASQFTANTLKDFPGNLAPVKIIPYGFPPIAAKRSYSSFAQKQPIKVLFVGGLSQRKGIADLISAVEKAGPLVDLTIVGKKTGQSCQALDAALSRHRWIPGLSHSEILKIMQAHDVLAFPSLFEGFGLVITEAMSQGTPVITTNRTIGPDIIEDGKNGWLVEPSSSEALQIIIEKLIRQPELIAMAGKAAMETARKRPWDVYEKELANAVSNF